MNITYELIKSWSDKQGNVNTMEEISGWVKEKNESLKVDIHKIPFSYNGFWHYDDTDGYIKNNNNSFFEIAGYQEIEEDHIIREQPVILQSEIGYLGILCKMVDGTLNFLMQAKVEPGNINVIQISPTIQATKSNFTKKHGGSTPAYLEYFENADKYTIIVDQLQSEQASRFMGKRNRNIVLLIDEDIEVLPSHKWMTLGQIKECMKKKNLVNMDTRTVLSCIPIDDKKQNDCQLKEIQAMFCDKSFFSSVFKEVDEFSVRQIFNKINDYRMYKNESARLVPLKSLKSWKMGKNEIVCKMPYDFKVVYCYIEIEGREVRYWEQPLFEAIGISVFGVFTVVDEGVRKFLVKVKPELGSYDGAELGPVLQMEPSIPRVQCDAIETMFVEMMDRKEGIVFDNILSEEGGRFYHEQNRNIIIELQSKDDIEELPPEYFWLDYATLNHMVQFNNCVNIQLRNLLAVLEL